MFVYYIDVIEIDVLRFHYWNRCETLIGEGIKIYFDDLRHFKLRGFETSNKSNYKKDLEQKNISIYETGIFFSISMQFLMSYLILFVNEGFSLSHQK